jgi:ABC-type dipeptide/oligopeptide/nickel transport system permease subunit
VQYLHYMGNLLRGNLGYSYKLNQNVDALFRERWARSVYLTGITLVLSVMIAVPLDIYQAIRRNTLGDYMVTSLAFIVYAMPVFFLGLILIQVFSLNLHVFGYEASQSNSIFAIVGDWHDMFLPVLTLTLLTIASFSRYMRSTAMDVAGPGLHQGGAGQRAAGVAGADAAPAAQRLPAHDHADRAVHPVAAGREPDHRDPVQLPRPGAGHPLGTSNQGYDELALIMNGGQAALEVGFFAAAIATSSARCPELSRGCSPGS